MPTKGRRRLAIAFCLLDQILTARPNGDQLFRGISSTAPADMRVVGVWGVGLSGPGGPPDQIQLLVESAEWEESDGEPPLYCPEFTNHYEGERRLGVV